MGGGFCGAKIVTRESNPRGKVELATVTSAKTR